MDTLTDDAPGRFLTPRERRRTARLALLVPGVAVVLTTLIYLVSVATGWIPPQWVSHVDGQGHATHSAHWPLAAVTVAAAVVTVGIGWLVSREYLSAGHWHDLEKGITVCLFALAHGLLGVLLATVLASAGQTVVGSGAELVGFGLLGFVLAFILAAVLYTVALPRARVDRWTPHH